MGGNEFLGEDIHREVFRRDSSGLREVDTTSDADEILEQLLHEPDEMRFRLIYDGELKAGGSKRRAAEKWKIRHAISPQIAELYEIHPVLQGEAMAYGGGWGKKEDIAVKLRGPKKVGNYEFIPLVRNDFKLTCSLDILFLRKQEPGSVIGRGGDLDNRLKLLFDGLRIPKIDEMKTGEPDAAPFYSLLEDDDLITDFSVRTDRLLSRPGASSSEVRLVIDVLVRPSLFKHFNSGFMGD